MPPPPPGKLGAAWLEPAGAEELKYGLAVVAEPRPLKLVVAIDWESGASGCSAGLGVCVLAGPEGVREFTAGEPPAPKVMGDMEGESGVRGWSSGVIDAERGAMGCNCPCGSAIAGTGVGAGADAAVGGDAGSVEFSTAAAPEGGGSADFGAVDTPDPSDPVDTTAPVAPAGCGKRIGTPDWPRWVEPARKVVDAVTPVRTPALPARELLLPRCALAEQMVSARAAKAATRICNTLRHALLNIMPLPDTVAEPGGCSREPIRPLYKGEFAVGVHEL